MKGDKIFYIILIFFSYVLLFIIILLGLSLLFSSIGIFEKFGIKFIISSEWDPVKGIFGIFPLIVGSFLVCFIALIIAVPLSLLIGYFISEVIPLRFKFIFSSFIELIAAIPSVIYGLWALLVFSYFLREYIYRPLQSMLGFIPIFQGNITGLGILTAGIVLAIMILPTITLIIKDAIELLPISIKEAVISLGATKYEVAKIIFKHIRFPLIGGIILGFARAFGEAMAVAMIIGSKHAIPISIFDTGYTMPSVIVNEFTEAISSLHIQALIATGFMIFIIALVNIIIARIIIHRSVSYLREAMV